MINCPVIQQLRVDDLLDNLLQDLPAEVLGGDTVGVLGGYNNSVDPQRDHGTVLLFVLDSDLSFRVGPEPVHGTCPSGDGHGEVQLVGQHDGEGHVLLSLICSIAEHDTLITSTHGFESSMIKTLGNIGALLFNGHENVASLVVEALLRVVVSDPLDCVANDLLIVELGLGGDFTKDHDHTSLACGFASDLGKGVLREAGIELVEN